MSNIAMGLYPNDKGEMYALLEAQLKALTEGITEWLPNFANASALLWGALEDINWAGFYLMKAGELLLGPFQGKPACVRIAVGKGVCGTAAEQNAPQMIKNVHLFPGHIACDCESNSEIVIPLHYKGEVVGVLDIDSKRLDRFDEQDLDGLKRLVDVLEHACNMEVML